MIDQMHHAIIGSSAIRNRKYMDKWPNTLTSVWPFTKLYICIGENLSSELYSMIYYYFMLVTYVIYYTVKIKKMVRVSST